MIIRSARGKNICVTDTRRSPRQLEAFCMEIYNLRRGAITKGWKHLLRNSMARHARIGKEVNTAMLVCAFD